MPVLSSAVGQVFADRTLEITPRMTMAFAAAIGATEDIYMDDAAEGGILAPPPYCVCLEWPLLFDARCRTLTGTSNEEAWNGLHVQQDSSFHRPIRPGDRLRTVGRITHMRATRAGALMVAKMSTTEAATQKPVVTSWIHTIFRGLYVDGGDRAGETGPTLPKAEPAAAANRASLFLPRTLPHAYTECAGIWNPIHTERRVALRLGLPDIILHGSCTWALAALHCTRIQDVSPARLKRFGARFEAMVIPGSEIVIDASHDTSNPDRLHCTVLNAEGKPAIADGIAEFAADAPTS